MEKPIWPPGFWYGWKKKKMGDNDKEVKGYKNLFFDPLTECYIIYVYGGSTFIEVAGLDRIKVAKKVHDCFFPPTPAEVKTIY